MDTTPKCYGIIPARFGSTRFPGKPLADILGKPMFWHVYHQASKCPDLHQVVLATDNDEIYAAAKKLEVPAIMTRNDHASGTD
ncbi:MAG: NTP transferase domain-containing protein, partial [Deltaproteobacteria bacterium]|nr:NTP transferase domain-containing protein [Deltaproteobacteria bacterium]